MKNAFQDKVALITGATSGIGEATAHQLASLGAKVVVSGRREKEGQAVVDAIRQTGGSASFFRADTSREADIKALVDFTVRTYGGLHYAFNNAGVEGESGQTADQQTEENYRHIFDVNVLGVLLSQRHELPAMVASGGGAIVNTTSVAGTVGMAGMSAYVASKHAVIGLTRSTALEFAQQGVRINAVAPGAIETAMVGRLVGDEAESNPQRDWLTSQHPIGRIGKAEEVASAVVSLLENPFITGTVLAVDGGWTAQ